jgi:transitional endoplasmic reticulum ATPase
MSSTDPSWAQEMRTRYIAREASMFLFHGNVRDVYPWTDDDGDVEYVAIGTFFERFLLRTRDIVAHYNVSQGTTFPSPRHEKLFQRAIDARRAAVGEAPLDMLPRSANLAIPLIEELVTDPTQPSGVVVDYFEMIAPNGDVSFMGDGERANLVSIQRWSADPALLSTNNLVILVTEHLADVSRRIVASPMLATISVSFPEQAARQVFIEHEILRLGREAGEVKLDMSTEVLAKVTAGLSLVQIRSILSGAAHTGENVSFRTVSRRKKTIIEQECHGLVEFVDPHHDFSHVGGMERVKRDLLRVADAVKQGRKNQVPMGMIFVGPMGTGKTFVAEAFAAECGLTCLKFKNFREKWVGSTEGNLEKVLDLVDALGYVLLIVDEADRSLSSGDSDGGTSSRVIARLKEFMSDTSHRGRVVVLMMTNRPDKLDTDLKRPGRFDFKIPFFYPEEGDERKLILQALIRKNKLDVDPDLELEGAVDGTEGYSGAELEAVLLTASNLAAEAERDAIAQADLDQAVQDVIPSRDTRMLEYMEMLAVFESSARRMLPDRYRDISTEDVHARLDQLRLQLGRRAG